MLDEAEAELRAVSEGRQPSAIELLALGSVDLRRGRTAEAALRFEQALTVSPLVAYRVMIGYHYAVVGRHALAVPNLSRAFEIDRACADFVHWSPPFAAHRNQPGMADLLGRYRGAR